jgi:hypothetical protein
LEGNYAKPTGGNNNYQGSKWVPPVAFIAMGLVGYVGFVWLRGNYLDALAIPLIVGFVWLAGMKQKLAWAVALVALYVLLAVPAMAAGWMDWQMLNPIISGVVLMVVAFTMTRLPLQKSAVLVAFVVLALGLLFTFSFIEAFTFVTLSVGLGAGLLSLYLFPHWRQEPSS